MYDKMILVIHMDLYLEKTDLWKRTRRALSMPDSFDSVGRYLVRSSIDVPLTIDGYPDSTTIYSEIDDIIQEQAEMIVVSAENAYECLSELYDYLVRIAFNVRETKDDLGIEGKWVCECYGKDDIRIRRLRS